MATLNSPRETYLALLEQWEYNLALNSQWVLLIKSFPNSIAQKIASLEGNNRDWQITPEAYAKLTGDNVQHTDAVGCFFADSATIPGESYDLMSTGLQNANGFMRTSVAGSRADNISREFALTFRETNGDFIEKIIKPWIIVAAHQGYFAYSDSAMNIRTNIQVISYSRMKHTPNSPYDAQTFRPVRKIYNFYNCAPIGVLSKNLSYQEDQSAGDLIRAVRWSYDTYTMSF